MMVLRRATRFKNALASARRAKLMTHRFCVSLTVLAPVLVAAASFIPSAASAQALFFHVEGAPGDRQAYYSQTLVMDRTPPSQAMGPIEIKQLDITVIHENAAKPEWTMMRAQFECPSMLSVATGKAGKAIPNSAPVKMRVGEGSSILRRRDLQNESLPAGSWATTSNPAMLKARKLACNAADIEKAMFASYRNQRFDMSAFNAKLKPFGFTEAVMVLAETTAPEQLELSWSRLWRDSKRPDPSGRFGKPATDADRTAAAAKMAVITKELETLAAQLRAKYEKNIKTMAAGFEFDDAAAKLRGDRKPRGVEAQLLMVWQAKPQEDVVAKMGRPLISDSGDLRVLSYGQQYDNRVLVGSTSGATWVEGTYMACDVQFVTIPDRNRVRRVADVRIGVDSNKPGWGGASTGEACGELLQAPGK